MSFNVLQYKTDGTEFTYVINVWGKYKTGPWNSKNTTGISERNESINML